MQLAVSGTAPATAAFVVFGVEATRSVGASVTIDDARWDYAAPIQARRMAYRAVQDALGVSGVVEPTWPTTLGSRVTDGTVIWEAVQVSWIEWTAQPIIESGLTEPAWPTTVGAFIRDGTANWECVSRRVEDENCPNTKVVAIMASKVFAADRDIIRFSATANPLDWTTRDDAGYLPSGLQQANSNDMAVLQPYRGNLGAWNPNGFQMWQVDPDPSQMALLDQMDGVGSSHTLAATAVGNDLYFVAAPGVRSVGIANAAENLQAGDVGMPIDVLVQAAMVQAAIDGKKMRSTYWPGMGQYWLCAGDQGETAGAGGALSLACPTSISVAVGQAYSYTYVATGGTAPYTFSVVSGTLPPGLTLNASTGVLSGTVTTAGSYSFGVQVQDALGVVAFCGWAAEVLEDEAEVVEIEWLATGEFFDGEFLPSPDGLDWTGAQYTAPADPNHFSPATGGFIARSGNELLAYAVGLIGGTGRRIAHSPDLGTTWASYAGGGDANGDEAAHIGNRWYMSYGTPEAQYLEAGALQNAGFSAQTLCAGGGYLFTADNDELRKRDSVGALVASSANVGIDLTASASAYGSGAVGLVALQLVMTGVTRCNIRKVDAATMAVTTVTTPFADLTGDTSALPRIHYSEGAGLWVVIFGQKLAYGADLSSLTLSGYTLPGRATGIGDDGGKFIICTNAGMAISSNLESFTTNAIQAQDVVALGEIA